MVDKNKGNYQFFFISGKAIDQNVKYLVPTSNGKYLEKATYFKFAGNDAFYFKLDHDRQPKISRKDIVIDLPPRKGSLKLNDTVLMPVEQPDAKCGPKNHDIYLNGTFLATQERKDIKGKTLWLVKSVYTRTYISFVPDSQNTRRWGNGSRYLMLSSSLGRGVAG